MDDDSRCFPQGWLRVDNVWTFKFCLLGKELWTDDGEPLPEVDEVTVLRFVVVEEGTQIAMVKEVEVSLAG